MLDYGYDDFDPKSELGVDTYQAIKYVYRGTETVDSDHAQANIYQIGKDLAAIK